MSFISPVEGGGDWKRRGEKGFNIAREREETRVSSRWIKTSKYIMLKVHETTSEGFDCYCAVWCSICRFNNLFRKVCLSSTRQMHSVVLHLQVALLGSLARMSVFFSITAVWRSYLDIYSQCWTLCMHGVGVTASTVRCYFDIYFNLCRTDCVFLQYGSINKAFLMHDMLIKWCLCLIDKIYFVHS